MKFVKNVTAIHGQTVPKLGLQPGSWVTVGQSGKVTVKVATWVLLVELR